MERLPAWLSNSVSADKSFLSGFCPVDGLKETPCWIALWIN
jgi:hypothetical protein